MYHFIGIKGSGMSSLAHIVLDMQETVTGSDVDSFIFTQTALENRNVKIYPFQKENIKDGMNVIVGNSYNEEHEEVKAAIDNPTVTVYTYKDFLAKLLTDYVGVSVVGTHGKTTTTGMLSHILEPLKRGYLIGDGSGKMVQNAKYFVAECCEFQNRFLAYHPKYAVLLNMELDHVDFFGTQDNYERSFQIFVNQVEKGIALNGDEHNIRKLEVAVPHLYFGFEANNDVVVKNIRETETSTTFDVDYRGEFYETFTIGLVGKHMIYDALGAITTLILMDIDKAIIKQRIQTFEGTKRRFSVEKVGEYVYIDDYAHHPTAIAYTIDAAKKSYPGKKVVAIFKPDRPSRITHFFEEFIAALKQADEIVITAYPSSVIVEENMNTAKQLAERCGAYFAEYEDYNDALEVSKNKEAVYLCMSTKDVYKFKDLIMEIQGNK